MGSYKIEFRKSAEKELRDIEKTAIPKLIESIQSLVSNPFPIGSKKLRNSNDFYRIRIWNYRVIYSVDPKILIITIHGIGHRKDVYRKKG